jgi:N-acetylmuramoyl-L-alanine amidase
MLFGIIFAGNSLDVIVIDAGHGGKDPGTIGLSGIKEKDIVLPIALKFGELVQNAFPDVKIIYTRTKDDYPEVHERTVLANKENAKLFISIHANYKKHEETDKKGFEIYLINKERFPEAVQITSNENRSVKYEQLGNDTVSGYIFSNLVQTGYRKYSELLASKLQYSFSETTAIQSRGVMQAGYWVIVGSSMPSVLVECGYLSDAAEEKYLSSKEGQEKVVQALFNAFAEYKKYYEMY